ncbi:hypothetical protein NCAS_0A12540 [Naumovozyma castellii]|uniref:Formate/nitrite transporter n=1 Tax=Naumovozyma castellii TaxID=27288 RepID=G0V8L3_NAUCA|nr:hypothetical protein NCAS_0A12540 [Naumovozyma castellii CBS 4309]CCC67812.1 hypothetical protein NCAS_0A12540 [Naumovozyma castellii CBS 4309]
MVDDTYYITPHEAALAVVATAMKKARLQIDTLIVNSLVGGIFFSSGAALYIAIHSDNPKWLDENPGILNMMGSMCFGLGLFYVVIMGVDLFNSNILFFSVGVLRGAVTIYDLLVSWIVSWLCNIGGTLFVSYLFIHVNKVGSSEDWVKGSILIAEGKASFSFMESFLKGIAGNFFVALAIYLQLLAKPTHVKLLLVGLPIFTFVTIGWSHAVADMTLMYVGMLNGANVSVGEYIWKLLIPVSLGNIIGGSAFGLIVPFYLHLVVVERDRKKLKLPEYEARDEQPELNMDSRVVRVKPFESPVAHLGSIDSASSSDDESSSDGDINEKYGTNESSLTVQNVKPATLSSTSALSPYSSMVSSSAGSINSQYEVAPSPYRPTPISVQKSPIDLSRCTTSRTATADTLRKSKTKGSRSRRHSFASLRSPPGVFPVRGMGEPLAREKTIENSNYIPTTKEMEKEKVEEEKEEEIRLKRTSTNMGIKRTITRVLTRKDDEDGDTEERRAEHKPEYNAEEDKPGAKLGRAITRLVERTPSAQKVVNNDDMTLPMTTQDTFPHNSPEKCRSYNDRDSLRKKASINSLLRKVSRQFEPSNAEEIRRELSNSGVTPRAAMAAQNVAGMENFNRFDTRSDEESSIDSLSNNPNYNGDYGDD